jgi:hypothetical protein
LLKVEQEVDQQAIKLA